MIAGKDEEEYTLIVIGDIDSDGENTVNDLAAMKLHFIGKETLSGMNLLASDIDGDEKSYNK